MLVAGIARFIQGFGQGFVFVPLQTMALSTIRMERLSNATAAFNVVRNFGGSIGIAVATTVLARRSQYHQTTLTTHVNVWARRRPTAAASGPTTS